MRRLGCYFIMLALLITPARGWAANACQVSASDADALIEKFFREQGISTETRAAARTARSATSRSYTAMTIDPAAVGESRQITSTVKTLQSANRELQQAVRESGYSEAFIRELKAQIPPGEGLMRVVSPEEAENILREGEMGSGYDFGMKPGDVRLGHGKNYIIVRCADCSDVKFVHGELGSSEVNTSRIPASKLEFIVLKPKAAEEQAVRDVFTPPPPMAAWRNSVEDPGRLQKAEAVLGRPVSEKEWQAIWKAHNVGAGPPYTPAEIAEKARILREEGGFSMGRSGEIRKLQASWVTGHMPLTRESTPQDIVDSLSQGVSEDNRYVSIPTPDGQARQAVRIDSVEHYGGETHVTAEIYDTHTHASLVRELYPQELAGMRISSTARQGLANTGGNVVLDESNRYVSFMLDGDRVAGKIVGIEKSDNGELSYWVQHHSYDAQGRDVLVNNHLTEEQAQTLRFSSSARAHFSHQPEAPAPRHIRLFNGQIRPHSDFNGALGVAEYRPQGTFLDFDGSYALPKQGWKIHVSAKPENAQQVADLVLPELRKMGVVHKVVGTLDDYKSGFVNPVSRFGGPNTQVGKFITIYPKDQQQAAEIAKKIDEILTRNHLGGDSHFLAIPGEGRMGNSGGVFVRYGEFTGDDHFTNGLLRTDAHGYVLDRAGKHVVYDGQYLNVNQMDIFSMDAATKQRVSHLLESSGSVVPDVRGAYKPEWVPDPFNAHP